MIVQQMQHLPDESHALQILILHARVAKRKLTRLGDYSDSGTTRSHPEHDRETCLR